MKINIFISYSFISLSPFSRPVSQHAGSSVLKLKSQLSSFVCQWSCTITSSEGEIFLRSGSPAHCPPLLRLSRSHLADVTTYSCPILIRGSRTIPKRVAGAFVERFVSSDAYMCLWQPLSQPFWLQVLVIYAVKSSGGWFPAKCTCVVWQDATLELQMGIGQHVRNHKESDQQNKNHIMESLFFITPIFFLNSFFYCTINSIYVRAVRALSNHTGDYSNNSQTIYSIAGINFDNVKAKLNLIIKAALQKHY